MSVCYFLHTHKSSSHISTGIIYKRKRDGVLAVWSLCPLFSSGSLLMSSFVFTQESITGQKWWQSVYIKCRYVSLSAAFSLTVQQTRPHVRNKHVLFPVGFLHLPLFFALLQSRWHRHMLVHFALWISLHQRVHVLATLKVCPWMSWKTKHSQTLLWRKNTKYPLVMHINLVPSFSL